MDRADYMRLKGALTHASETRHAIAQRARSTHGELQGATSKLTADLAQQAHTLIDALLALQQQEAHWTAQEAHFRKQLAGETPPND